MDKVYITGHRNPDTDSIVSAMAYAALKNALGQRQYCAARLGDRKSTRLNSSHSRKSRMPSSA